MSAPMTPERWKRLSELFERALEATEGDRQTLIERECGGDGELAAQLRSLLAMQPQAEGFLEQPGEALDMLSPMLATPGESDGEGFHDGLAGRRVAGYRVIKQIGEGGMGVVYLAEQLKPRRTVALKIIRAGLATPSVLKRFEHEAHILGRLQHPGIAQIYEAGAADDASGVRGFFAMEYVRGKTLAEHAKGAGLSAREKLDLIARIADAVQHAHQKGVIHRDLKPSNILVDGQGQPKILDFGVARATDADVNMTTMRTSVGQLIGTLPYMSPEQVIGDPGDVDTRSDVYALGVTLYELLTGRLPHDVRSRSIPEAARIIRDEEPTRLSAVDKGLRGDVETIVAKALEKDKADRYQSAAEFAADIRRFLAGEPIGARRDSATYVLKQQLRRYRGAAAVVAVAVLSLASFAVYAARQSALNERLAQRESLAKGEAIAARERAEAERNRADADAERLRRELYFGRIGYAQAALAQGDVPRVRRLLEECPEDLRGWEWGYLNASSDQSDRHIDAHPPGWGGGAFGRNSPVFATLRLGEEAVIRDGRTGAERFRIATDTGVMNLALSQDGRYLALAGRMGEVYVQDLQGEEPRRPALWTTMEATPRTMSLGEDGARIAIIDSAGDLRVYDRETGEESQRLEGRDLTAVDLRGDGRLALGTGKGEVLLVDGDRVTTLGSHEDAARGVAFDAEGARIASAGNDGAVRAWDVATGSALWMTRAFKNKAAAVAWSADGSTVYSGGTEARLVALDAASGEERWRGLGHASTILNICGASTGEVLTTGVDGQVRWWTAESVSRAERAVSPTGRALVRAAALLDGFAVSDWDGAVVRLSLEGQSRPLRPADGKIGFALASFPSGLAMSVGEEELAAISFPLGADRWRALKGMGTVRTASGSSDGAFVAATVAEGTLFILAARDGAVLARVDAHPEGAHLVAWHPNSRRVFTCGILGMVRSWAWDPAAATLTLETERAVSTTGIWTMSIGPDGRRLILGGDEGDGLLIDSSTLQGIRLVGHQGGAIYSSCFHPDGTRVVTGAFDNTARVWDTATGEELLALRSHRFAIHGMAFDASGRTLLTVGGDGLAILRQGGPSPTSAP